MNETDKGGCGTSFVWGLDGDLSPSKSTCHFECMHGLIWEWPVSSLFNCTSARTQRGAREPSPLLSCNPEKIFLSPEIPELPAMNP